MKIGISLPVSLLSQELCKLEITNSKARKEGDTNNQKILLRSGVNIGEVELRNDSKQHYREVKFRVNGWKFLEILQASAGENYENREGLIIYGDAKKTFKRVI